MSEQKQVRDGGVESKLDGVGIFYLFLSIIVLVGSIYLSQDETIKKSSFSTFYIVLGIGVFAQGIIFWILFQAAAEIIRLLKKLNGLPYGGAISETTGEGLEYTCTDCGAPVAPDAKVCTQCGAKFDD